MNCSTEDTSLRDFYVMTLTYCNSSTRILLLKNSDWKNQIELKFFQNLSKILLPSSDKIQIWEVNEYKRKHYLIPLFHFDAFNFCLPNLLETTLCHQIFVFWVKDLKFWLLAYFFILLSCAKFQQDWTTLVLDIL